MLIERLYQTGTLPPSVGRHRLSQATAHLEEKLAEEIRKPYLWLAVCTAAVEGGRWGGERRRNRRLKLLRLINICRERLGEPTLSLPEGWERTNLFYDYGATHQYAEVQGKSLDEAILTGLSLSR